MARAARAAGDVRSLDQLRSDLLCDLVLFGVVPAASWSVTGKGAPPGRAGEGPEAWSGLSDMPPATVRLVVPFEVAAGLSDAACELVGHGWVTAPMPARS